jgi:hypothetical protein
MLPNVKRVLLSFALLIVLFPVGANASKVSSKINPIASQTKNGQLSLGVFLGEDTGMGGRSPAQQVQVRVCDGTICEIYNALSHNSWEGYSSHLWTWMTLDIDAKLKDRPVTVQIPKDLINGQNGWSQRSNQVIIASAVTPHDPLDFYRKQLNRPPLEIVYSSLDPTGMKRVDLCLNFRESFVVSKLYDAIHFGLDISRHKSIRSELFHNGVLTKTQNFSIRDVYGNSFIPGCSTGTLGSNLMTSIDGLVSGKNYKLVYTLIDEFQRETTAELDFVTPGGCPTGEVLLPPSPRTFHYGILNDAGILVSYQFAHWSGEDLPSWMAPIYHSGSKVIPFKGNLTDIRTSSEKWRFLRDVEEWALVLDDATPQSPSDVLTHTVFADCKPTQTTTKFLLDENTVSATEQGCAVINNKVVPIKPGICMIDASITSRKVKSSTAKSTKPTLISMNYVISKVAKTKRLQNKASVTFRSKAARGSVLTSTSLLSPSKGARVVRITSRTSSVCRPKGTSLRMLKKGKCRYTATVVRKGKPSTVSSVIRVS